MGANCIPNEKKRSACHRQINESGRLQNKIEHAIYHLCQKRILPYPAGPEDLIDPLWDARGADIIVWFCTEQ